MKSLKILHYIPGFNTGGIESVYLNWYKNLPDSVDFELLVRSYDKNSPLINEYLRLGGKIHTLDMPSINPMTIFSYISKVSSFFRNYRSYDYLHIHVPDDPFIVPIARIYGIKKVVVHSHTTGYNESFKNQKMKVFFRNINIKLATHRLAITKVAAEWMYGSTDEAYILHNGINAETYCFDETIRKAVRDSLGINNELTLMHVGRFSEVKNHKFILEIFEELLHKIPTAKLVLIGDGPLFDKFKKNIQEKSLNPSVTLLGARGDVPLLLQGADIFLLPSKFEGLGLSAIESQAAGLITLVSEEVPKDVQITDLVRSLPLSNSEIWVDTIINLSKEYRRLNTKVDIIAAGYDIKSTTEDLISFYQNNLSTEGNK